VAVDTKPTPPSFTLKEIAQPYDVSPTTTTTVDPFTGEETTITYSGYTVENKTIYIVIKNQLFTPYKNANGEMVYLYYECLYRGHYYEGEGGWSILYLEFYEQSDLEYTFISFRGLPSSGKVDVKVKGVNRNTYFYASFADV